MGTDAQGVINSQISDDYDLFIGIMWCRFGTPTGRAGSGTQEEFQRAKDKFDKNPDSVKIMMYFKDGAVQPSQLDVQQLTSVNEFRDSLGKEGGLYWKFNDLNDFEKFIRMHLSRQIQDWKRKEHLSSPITKLKTKESSLAEIEQGSDWGILDFAEIFEERFAEVKDLSVRIAAATESLGIEMSKRTTEISDLPRDSQGNANRSSAKRLISRAAIDMNQYAERMNTVMPLFGSSLNTGMDAFLEYIRLSVDIKDSNSESDSALGSVVELAQTMESSKQSMYGFRETIFGLPRMTSELNKAKRAVVSVLDRFIDELTTGQAILAEAEAALQDMFDS